jgi:hypothetical protein
MTRRVFIVAPAENIDTDPAKKYGPIVFLFPEHSPSPFRTEELIRELESALLEHSFNPEEDYFAISGPFLPLSLATFALGRLYRKVNFLVFDARMSDYVVRVISAGSSHED